MQPEAKPTTGSEQQGQDTSSGRRREYKPQLNLWRPPLYKLPVHLVDEEGDRHRFVLELRPFQLGESGELLKEHGADWFAKAALGNAKLAIAILAGQLHNRQEFEAFVGQDAEEGLRELLTPDSENMQALMHTLSELHRQSQPEALKKKVRVRAMKKLLTSLLHGCFIAAAICLAVWTAS